MRKYNTAQISRALDLIDDGFTRKKAAKLSKMGIHSLNYYIAKDRAPKIKTRPLTLTAKHINAIKVLHTLL